jgi:hypothetical protein
MNQYGVLKPDTNRPSSGNSPTDLMKVKFVLIKN